MLGQTNAKQKEKQQLVFKLLKTMNPYLPEQPQQTEMKTKLRGFLSSAHSIDPNAIRQLTQEYDESEYGSHGHKTGKRASNGKTDRQIAHRIFNIKIANGSFNDIDMPEIGQGKVQIEMQAKRIKKDIQKIQESAYKQFNIRNNKNMISMGITDGKYSCLLASGQNRYSSRNSENSGYKYYRNGKVQTSHSNSHRMDNILMSQSQFQWNAQSQPITDRPNMYQSMRSQLGILDSPIKTYRHELQPSHTRPLTFNSNISTNYLQHIPQLGLQSNIRPTQIRRSNSELIHNRNQKQKQKDKSYNKPKQQQKMTKHNSNLNISISRQKLIKSGSQRVVKQAQKLEMEILASIIHNKMNAHDRSNTIAHLTK